MKKYFKMLIILLSFIVIITKTYAEDKPEKISELGEQQVVNCTDKTVTLTGCFYNNDTASQYENIDTRKTPAVYDIFENPGFLDEERGYVIVPNEDIKINSMKFDRAYSSINKNGDTVVGVCYKGYIKHTEEEAGGYYLYYEDEINATKQSNDDLAIIYLRIFNGNCKSYYRDQIVFQDPKRAHKIYMGWDTSNNYPQVATVKINTEGYEAYKDLQCPKYMSFTENLAGLPKYFNLDLEYVFSDDDQLKHKNNWFDNLIGLDAQGRITGCIEESVEYHEDLTKCFDEKVKLVNDYVCPEKLTDIKVDTKTYIDNCTEEYAKKHNVDIESARFLANQTAEYAPRLKEAGNKKIDECYQKALGDRCKLTASEITSVRNKMKGTICESGCKILVREEGSEVKEGKCIACGASQGVTYKWASKDTTPSGNCAEVDLSYDKCLGDSKTQECRNCYEKACSDLTDEKKACLLNLTSESQQATDNNEDDVDDAFQDHEDETNEENADKIREMYWASMRLFYIPGLDGGEFGPKGQNCEEVLLKNIGVKIIKGIVNVLRIAAAIVAIANAMITLIPAIISKDGDGLKKAGRKLVIMAVVLAIIGILPSIVYLIGQIFGYDLTCIF